MISLIFLGILTTLTAYFLTDKTDGNFKQLLLKLCIFVKYLKYLNFY